MIARRAFNKYVLISLLSLLAGCDRRPKETPESITETISHVVDPVIDIAALFWSNEIIKGLQFLKIIKSAIADIHYDKDADTVAFKTTNAGVTGTVNLSSGENGSCSFTTPVETLEFSPAHFLRVNAISYGDEDRLVYVENKILDDYSQCTDEVLDSGESNHMEMLRLRLQCLQARGFEPVNLDYLKVKHVTYEV